MRRKLLLSLIAGGLLVKPAMAGWFGFGSNRMFNEVKLNIVDSLGKPIPYASIWNYSQWEIKTTTPDMSDIWRLANRYRDDYVFCDSPVKMLPGMGYILMSDKHGASERKYPVRTDNSAYEVGFVILKHGYQLAKAATNISKDIGDQTLTVTLQPDPESGPVPAYLEQFDRIRFENTSIDIRDRGQVGNAFDLARQLNALADEALRVGDKESAAKMLFYISYLPGTTPGGAQSVDFFSSQAIDARKKVAELKPDNAFIQLRLFGAEGRQFEDVVVARGNASPERVQAYAEFIERWAKFLDKMGDRAWPTDHATLIYDYRKLGMKEKMNAQIAKVRAMEPKLGTPNPQ
jgi:hypothetical protein